MIITKLIGGLGNQMFQYATGRQAACSNKTDLKLDITGYENQIGITKRQYGLKVFNINAQIAAKKETNKLKRQFPLILNWILNHQQSYIKEKYFHFDPSILKIRDNSYLEGYWISEKYFKDIEATIRKEFTFKNKPDMVNQRMIGQIKNCDSVSIHIRRGDYVLDKKTNQHHGVCSLKYYQQAIRLITQRVRQPYFFIFSDDPQWVEKHLKLQQPMQVVNHNYQKNHHEDMRLMTFCRHHIIANSSFSWWGAWLNSSPDKIVIAPKKWFRDPSINTKDLIPQSWIKI